MTMHSPPHRGEFIKPFIAAIFLIYHAAYAAEEPCPLERLNEEPYADIECLFYLGTAAYRAGINELAVAHWKIVSGAEPEGRELDTLIYTALSNLGHHTYYGIGTEQDRMAAVELWKRSAKNGELSARSYLGYAYSDSAFSARNDVVALAWFKSIFLQDEAGSRFGSINERLKADTRENIIELEARLALEERKEADEMAHDLTMAK